MPIEKLFVVGAFVFAGVFAAHPFDFQKAIHQFEFSILRDVGRTDNWGDPSLPFRYSVPRYFRQVPHPSRHSARSGE